MAVAHGAGGPSLPGWRGVAKSIVGGLKERRLEPELMDDPSLDPALHEQALSALSRINRISLTDRHVAGEVDRLWAAGERPVRILDVGCGDADVLVRVGARARERGIDVELHGCDMSPVALDRARRRASASDVALVLSRLDVTREPLPGDRFSLVTCSLFLHHFTEDDAVALLGRMAAATRTMLVQDLRRTRLGLLMAWVGILGLTRSPVVHVDGLLSVHAAFTLREAAGLCARAGLSEAQVTSCWPQRFLIRHTSA